MWHIDNIDTPPGHNFSITGWDRGRAVPVKLGDRLGPKGQNYEIRIDGLGSMTLSDMGDIGGKDLGPYGVGLNGREAIWYYDGEGTLLISVAEDKTYMAYGGKNPDPVTGRLR